MRCPTGSSAACTNRGTPEAKYATCPRSRTRATTALISSAPPGCTGDFVCTNLLNPDMLLIRYRVGDRGRLAPPEARCECGRALPLIQAIDGRNADMLLTADGRQVFWLNPVFYGLPVRQSQIIQESLTQLHVRVAPAPGWGPATGHTVRERLKARMGEVAIALDLVDEVPRTASGKLQAVVCRLPADVRQRILSRGREAAAGVA